MGHFADDVVRGFKSVRQAAGLSITIRRGTAETSATAVPGDSLHEFMQEGQTTVETKSRDFLILASDYKINDAQTLPRKNDRIIESGKTYAVLSDGGEAYFRYSDPGQQILRIHCTPRPA